MGGTNRNAASRAFFRSDDSESPSGTRSRYDERFTEEVVRRSKIAWPDCTLDSTLFARQICAAFATNDDARDQLAKLNIEDLFLAYACSKGDTSALRAFDRMCSGELKAVGNQFRLSAHDQDDVRQQLWNKLFLSEPDALPKILDYRGSGRLRLWYRVLATRHIISERRSLSHRVRERGTNNEFEMVLASQIASSDPELASLKQQYQHAFRKAFVLALKRLHPEERNLIRCYYCMEMSTSQVALAFGVHKATVARSLTRARETLLRQTRDTLKLELRVDSEELDSVMRIFDQELSSSLLTLLRDDEPTDNR